MTLRHFKIFKTVCEEGSITKAANTLFMAQPAVSLAIRELEEHYGIKLFDRIARKLYITPSGQQFLVRSRKILDLYEEMEQDAKTWDKNSEIKLGSSITIGTCVLPQILKDFYANFPNPLKVHIDNARQVELMVMNNKVDFAFIEGIVENPQLIAMPFIQNELQVCASKNHPLANRDHINIHDILKENFYLREKGSATRDVFDSALLPYNISISPIMTSVNSQSLIEAIKCNQGISVLPYSLIEQEVLQGDLCILPVQNIDLHQYYHIVYHKDKYINQGVQKFIDMVKEKYHTIPF